MATPKPPIGRALRWTERDILIMALPSVEEIATARALWHRVAPSPIRRLLDGGTRTPDATP